MRDKAEIRAVMRARRRAVAADVRAAVSKEICERLLMRADVCAAFVARNPVAVYLASPDEIDLSDFISAALEKDAVLVAPRWNGSVYELVPLESLASLHVGPHKILEPPVPSPLSDARPPTPAVWLVPGLAFARDGKRLGYGGGWYDRMMAETDEKTSKIGIAYAFQLADDLPVESHDVLLTDVLFAS